MRPGPKPDPERVAQIKKLRERMTYPAIKDYLERQEPRKFHLRQLHYWANYMPE